MKKLLATLCLTVTFQPASAEPNLNELNEQFPQLAVTEVMPTPVNGFWELLTDQGQIYYVTDAGDYLFAGELVSVASKDSLTEQRRQGLRVAMLGTAPGDLLQFPATKPSHEVTVVTDIDCGYCRRLHQQMDGYNERGITVNYLLMPRAGLSSESFAKARDAVCSADPKRSFTAAMLGQNNQRADCENTLAEQFQLAQQLSVSGTPTIVFDDGRVIPGYVTPEQLLDRLNQD